MSKTSRHREADAASSSSLPWWRQRWGVIAVALAALLVLLFAYSGRSWPITLDILLRDGAVLILWLLAAAGYGLLFPLPGTGRGVGERGEVLQESSAGSSSNSARPSPPAGERESCLRNVTCVALGIGILSFLQLLLGLAGLLHRPIAFALIVVGLVLVALRWRTVIRWLSAPIGWDWLWLLAVPPLAAAIVAALVPPGVLWGDEPHGYDVLEYHLQLPREWLELGRITPLHHNVFSYFPLNVEMNYLLAMQLKGGPWRGMYLAQLMNLAMVALTVIAIYAAARTFAPKPHAILAALAGACVPWMLMLGTVAYNEGGMLLFGALTIAWLLCGNKTTRHWIVAGELAGFACGVKLTAVPLLLIAAPIVAALFVRSPRLGRGLLMFALAGTVTFSPWLIKNTLWARNPVFPEAQSVLGRAHFTPDQMERWKRAHAPREDQRSLGARLGAAKDQIVKDFRFGYVLIPLGVLSALITFRRPQSRFLLALLLAWLIFWLGFTHLQGRFFVLAIPIAAIALASWHPVAIVPIVVGMGVSLGIFTERAAKHVGIIGAVNFTEAFDVDVRTVLEKKGAAIALAGDAQAFYYQIPTQRLRYRTVFDVNTQPNQSILDAWLAGQSGSPYIIVNPFELKRFHETYYAIPPLGDDFPAPRDRISVLMPAAAGR